MLPRRRRVGYDDGDLSRTGPGLFADTRPRDDGIHEVVLVRLGDSSGWLLADGVRWVPLGDSRTRATSSPNRPPPACRCFPRGTPRWCAELAAGSALVLMSDGVGDPLGGGTGDVGRALAASWATPPHPIEFLAQVDFGRKTFDDDRAAVAVWPVAP